MFDNDKVLISKNEQERLARRKDMRRRRIKKILIWLLVLGAIAAAIYGLVYWSRKAGANKPGQAIAELERVHIDPGTKVTTYNSNPPTSGPHYPTWSDWGAHDEQIADEFLVHNLEHGGIWISYKNPEDKELIGKLKSIVSEYSLKVILTPRPENDAPIAVAAWGRLLKLESFDERELRDFIGAFINRGPEQVPY